MRIVVAPDSFKESMTAARAARAMAAGVRDALPSCAVDQVPVSDGGEGFAQAVTTAWGASWREVDTVDALGRPRTAGFGLDGDRAVVDLASSVGLEHIAPGERDVMRSSTIGLGRVMAAALDAGSRSLLIGLGGSASNDMGLGMLTALGARCLDAEGDEVEPVPAAFTRIVSIEAEPARRRLEDVSITVAGDVTNPLTGPHGAAAVFGPQKGLTEPAIAWVDGEMARLAGILGLSRWVSRPGTGAAGGTAFALGAVLGARLATGIDHLTRVVGLRERLEGADLLLTGEGALDGQSVNGKAVSGVLRLAHECRVPSMVFAGRVSLDARARRRLADLGARDIIQVSDPSVPVETSLRRGPDLLRRGVAHALRQRVQPCGPTRGVYPGRMKLEILHTGTVVIDETLPYHRPTDRPLSWTHLGRGRRHLIEAPVSCYLVEAPSGLVLIDTGWHTSNRTRLGQLGNLRHQYAVNKARLPQGQAIHEQLEARGIRPRDLDLVLLSHLHCDHADGLRLVRQAPRIMVSATELRAAEKDRARYLPHEWNGVDLQTFSWDTRFGPVQRAWDVFGDGSILMVSAPGHAWGLCATILRGGTSGEAAAEPSSRETNLLGDDPRDVVILSSDVGYGRPSFEQGLRPSVVVDAPLAQRSLSWVRAAAKDPRVKHLIANHDPEQQPRTIVF